jgi:hypothetical protein
MDTLRPSLSHDTSREIVEKSPRHILNDIVWLGFFDFFQTVGCDESNRSAASRPATDNTLGCVFEYNA